MLPFIATLLKGGLGLIANAALSKGKDWVEEQTGVKLGEQMAPEQLLQLKQFELEHEEELIRLRLEDNKLDIELAKLAGQVVAAEDASITERWRADMTSDSWLSKNIRPAVLIFLLGAYSLFSFGSAFDIDVKQAYIELLGQWGMLVMTAYFGGRSVEKVASIIQAARRERK